jgi:uncharacterized protein YlxW (UPF0749 family)
MAKALAKTPKSDVTPEERELQTIIHAYGAERVLKVWQSRMDQLTRQRTPEYRAQQAEKQRERKLADQRKIEQLEAERRQLEAELARARGSESTETDEEHAA